MSAGPTWRSVDGIESAASKVGAEIADLLARAVLFDDDQVRRITDEIRRTSQILTDEMRALRARCKEIVVAQRGWPK